MRTSIRLVLAGAIGAAVLTTSSAVAGAANATTCTGTLAPGTYGKIVVPAGAVCTSEGPITVHGGVFVGAGSTFMLGTDEGTTPTGTITGGVHATNAAIVEIHFARITGGVDVHGGSGAFGGPFGITWNAIEDNHISGGATVEGYNGFWFGFIRNTVNGSVNLNDNVLFDEDGNEYVTNTIHGDLNCEGNSPAPHAGDSGGQPNQVTGRKTGQCTAV